MIWHFTWRFLLFSLSFLLLLRVSDFFLSLLNQPSDLLVAAGVAGLILSIGGWIVAVKPLFKLRRNT